MALRRWLPLALLVAILGMVGLSSAAPPNQREVKDENPVVTAEASKGGKLWVLDFKFKDPRLIKVNIPGRGQKLCWYVWYQIVNRTGDPRSFVPDLELVTHDTRMTYRDQILPTAEEAIRKIEDAENYYKVKNSVTIAADLIPVSLPKATPKVVTGVAIWADPNDINPEDDEATKERKKKMPKLIDSNNYSIFVAGLSNGWSLTDPIPPSDKPVIRRKTLQLKFARLGDKNIIKSEAIHFKSFEWTYRSSQLDFKVPVAKGKDKEKEAPKD